MIDDTLAQVLQSLPARADEVRHRLGLTHEEAYAALVRLYDRGEARLVPSGDLRRIRVWEAA